MSPDKTLWRTLTTMAYNKLFKMFQIKKGLATQLQELGLFRLEKRNNKGDRIIVSKTQNFQLRVEKDKKNTIIDHRIKHQFSPQTEEFKELSSLRQNSQQQNSCNSLASSVSQRSEWQFGVEEFLVVQIYSGHCRIFSISGSHSQKSNMVLGHWDNKKCPHSFTKAFICEPLKFTLYF